MSELILRPQIEAGRSSSVVVKQDNSSVSGAHFTAPDIAGANIATVQKQSKNGDWHDYYINGVKQDITATNTGIYVVAPGVYAVNKGETTLAVGVEVSTNGSP